MKIIWWFVAAVNEGQPVGEHEGHRFGVEFHSYDSVLEKLTYKDDREMVKKAIELVMSSADS